MSHSHEPEDPRRRWLVKALGAGMLTSVWGQSAAIADGLLGAKPKPLPSGQSIYRIRGSVNVNGKAATLSTQVTASDVIETGLDSEVVFIVGGQAVILRGNSVLTMQKPKESTDNYLVGALRLLTGKLLSVSRSQGYHINTSSATIGVRGTGVYIEADPEQTYFCTCYGLADVSAIGDTTSRDTVQSQHHDKPLYILNNAPAGKAIRPAGFINHTDDELILLEALVGRTPPFVFSTNDYESPRLEY